MDNIGCKVIVKGLVQGVGFRYYTRNEAERLKLGGHAKNLYDGDVEVVLYGAYDNVTDMLKWLEKGPRTARVTDLEVADIEYVEERNFSCF